METDLTRSNDLIVLDGATFFFSDALGNAGTADAHGYFFRDVRHLSVWELRADGETLLGITAAPVDYCSALIVLAPKPENAGFAVRRERFVTEGVHEDLVVVNLEARERRLELELRFEADFPDIMEAQADGSVRCAGARSIGAEARRATLSYECDGFRRGTQIEFSANCSVH